MTKQIFGSSLSRPWALVKWGGNQPNGRRPSTTVAYLTDPIKNEAGEIAGYEGGIVEFYRKKPDPFAQWHFRYTRPRKFLLGDVCEFFMGCGKGRSQGPPQSEVRIVKQRVPPNPMEDAA